MIPPEQKLVLLEKLLLSVPDHHPFDPPEDERSTWEQRQNDPDNWLVIPEFGVLPKDVNFKGFALPILGPDGMGFAFQRPIREAVHAVRDDARRRFHTLAQLHAASARVVTDLNPEESCKRWTNADVFAWYYWWFFWYVKLAVQDCECAKGRSTVHLARALELGVFIRTSDPPRPDFARRVHSELSSKGGKARQAATQAAKKEVKKLWENWQKNPTFYDGKKTEFARAVLKKFPVLTSVAVIARWCKEWDDEAKTACGIQATQSAG